MAVLNDPEIDHVLANFEEPGKTDLASYMERNFMFNLPLEKIRLPDERQPYDL